MCQVWIEPKRTQDEQSLIMCSKIFTYDLNRERHQTNICWKQIKCWEAEARWLLILISILTSDIARFSFSAFLDILIVCRHCARKDSGAWGAHGGREVRTAVDVTHRRSRHFYDFSRLLSQRRVLKIPASHQQIFFLAVEFLSLAWFFHPF